MTIAEIKQISNSICTPHVEKMAKEIIDALLAHRIIELKQRIAQTDNPVWKADMKKKLSMFEQPYSHEFYNRLIQQTVKEILTAMQSKIESAQINLTNAEYFNLTGRLS